jgi:NTE family protein
MKKIGLALSGGGVRGFAHLGVLQALEEMEVKVSALSGVSAGAITGALYAAGYKAKEIFKLVKEYNYFTVSNLALSRTGIFSLRNIETTLKGLLKEDNFEHLGIPLFITATNLSEGRSVIFSSGKLSDKVMASASVPAVFQPVLIEGSYYVDGGVLNNFPVSCLKDVCDVVIGSHVNKLYDGKHIDISEIQIIEHCFHLAIANKVYEQALLCDVFLEPMLAGYNMFELKHAEKVFELGYKAAMEQKELILSFTS